MRRPRRPARRWDLLDDDPLAGLINLFDLWMVFAIALLIVLVGVMPRLGQQPGSPSLVDAQALTTYRLSHEPLRGRGERLGTAYRLPSGEIVCVPDAPGQPQ